ncbi:T9SS type A sorting domain-containing protein [Mucilaginibacter gotjawali]|nr:T9SS type A sorting domain-containing protein [Mucilaginibacter gotjawali]
MPGVKGSISQAYDIKIISTAGALIKTTTTTSASWQDNVSNLTPGTYIIQVVNNKDKSLVGKSTFVKM